MLNRRFTATACIAFSIVVTSGTGLVAQQAKVGAAEHRLALVVAIGAYPTSGGYKRINAPNDVRLIRSVLSAQRFNDVRELVDSAATKSGILAAIQKLTTDASPGDIVFLHYSGHGHQITDDNADETDGYDEVLVPFDAPNFARDTAAARLYAGERHIRDDELGILLDALRKKLGPQGTLLFTVDACFSGTIARAVAEGGGGALVRGELVPIGPPGVRASTARGKSAFSELVGGTTDALAPLVMMAAAREDQLDKEVTDGERWVGPLSYALSLAFSNVKRGDTYEALFSRVRSQMRIWRPSQEPQIEGPASLKIFAGGVVEYPTHYEAAVPSGGREVTLSAGTLQGITVGSEFAFYPPGADRVLDRPLATGRVSSSTETSAVVSVQGYAGPVDRLNGTWAFPQKLVPLLTPLRVGMQPSLPPRVKDLGQRAIADALAGSIAVDSAADVVIGRMGSGDDSLGVLVQTASGTADVGVTLILGPIARDVPDTALAIVNRLRAFARVRALLSLPLQDPSLDVSLILRPALLRISADGQCTTDTTGMTRATFANGVWRAYANGVSASPSQSVEGFVLEMRNQTEENLFISILDLGPEMGIRVMAPRQDQAPASLLLAKQSRAPVRSCFAFSKVRGKETLLMFATRRPVDFRSIESSLDPGARGALDEVSKALADAYHGTRSGAALPTKIGTMFSLLLEILSSP